MLVSQPFIALPSQLPKLFSQIGAHDPPLHVGTALGRVHFIPHMPQLLGSLASVASQPSAELPLQLPKPWLQPVTLQLEVMHDHIAPLPAQALPHRPQLARSMVTSLHCPPQQDSLPQSVPQPPQFFPSTSVSTQTWLQQACAPPPSGLGHWETSSQPVWQVYTLFTWPQNLPIGQLSFIGRQGTQLPVLVSQRGVPPPQSASFMHAMH